MPLRKILFGLLSSIREDAVFCSSVEYPSTVVSSLSASPTSLRTVLRRSSLPEISLFPSLRIDRKSVVWVTYLIEALLASNGNIRLESILGASWTNQNSIFAPGMHKDISGRDYVRNTVRNDVRFADVIADSTLNIISTKNISSCIPGANILL